MGHTSRISRLLFSALVIAAISVPATASTHTRAQDLAANSASAVESTQQLARTLKVGDVVFIRVSAKPFREVASATGSWTNHVGIVIDTSGHDPLIGESTFPFSRIISLSSFVTRSEHGRVAVSRLPIEMTPEQAQRVATAARSRTRIFYDTGFDLHSRRQFCSRYVREVLDDALGVKVGDVETLEHLLERHPKTKLTFWRIWFFGQIPWSRETVTPASLLDSPRLTTVFNGEVT